MAWIEYKGFQDGQFAFSGWVWCLIFLYFSTPLIFYMALPSFISNYRRRLVVNDHQIVVCVLGDLGHSPRMSYHTESLSRHGFNVRLCGYMESDLSPVISMNDDIEIYDIKVVKNVYKLPYTLFGVTKVLHQIVSLAYLLFDVMEGSKYILIQNPPSLPLLLIVVLLNKLWYQNCKVIIDWHNLNYSILNLRFKNLNHPVVRLVRYYEQFLGRYANLNLTVTNEMGRFLCTEFGLNKKKIVTLYDRAPSQFQPVADEAERQRIISACPDIFEVSNDHFTFDATRDKILITSTSFTEDEDFNSLIDALKFYDQEKSLPNILLIVTGKGPLKEQFLASIARANFSKIIVRTVWVSIEFYPLLLSVADVGVSLHVSSSGIDLPMKIVDLFGCGVPVISLRFQAIGELVKDGINGVIVDNSIQLFESLANLFKDRGFLEHLKRGALAEAENSWDDTWDVTFGKYLEQ